MDTVFVRKLSVMGKHGVLDSEREIEQEFLFDIAAEVDTRPASASDNIADAVDYMHFVRVVTDVVASRSFHLIESLGETIIVRIMQDTRIRKVAITIHKPAILESGVAGITMERTRV